MRKINVSADGAYRVQLVPGDEHIAEAMGRAIGDVLPRGGSFAADAVPTPAIADHLGAAEVVPYSPPAEMTQAQIAEQELAATDSRMARVTEDLISVLVARGVLAEGDLPQAARDKIAERSALRAQIAGA